MTSCFFEPSYHIRPTKFTAVVGSSSVIGEAMPITHSCGANVTVSLVVFSIRTVAWIK
ncbi:hypothetical protein D3C84_1219940 [compost metagenome]